MATTQRRLIAGHSGEVRLHPRANWFLFATGIENSYPVILNRAGTPTAP